MRTPAYTRDGRGEAVTLLALGVGLTALFALTAWDIEVAGVFYRAQTLDHWSLAERWPWSPLYRLAPWITASLAVLGIVALVIGYVRHLADTRRYAAFLLLSLVVGPGLIVNLILKDHWERPRPRDVIEFGGALQYVPAPLRGESGASFPCGHCSVGFLYGLGWWVWKRRRPRWAAASLGLGLTVGAALGVGRMAAGGHFLSDILWSALLAYAVAHLLYYHVLRIPESENQALPGSGGVVEGAPHCAWQNAFAAMAACGGVVVLLALFVTPHGTQLRADVPSGSFPSAPRVFELTAAAADVDVVVTDAASGSTAIAGELHGFGLPTSRLEARVSFESEPVASLIYRVVQLGWFADLDGQISVQIPRGQLRRIVIRVDRGNVRVRDATRGGVVRNGGVQLDLHTLHGRVQRPAA